VVVGDILLVGDEARWLVGFGLGSGFECLNVCDWFAVVMFVAMFVCLIVIVCVIGCFGVWFDSVCAVVCTWRQHRSTEVAEVAHQCTILFFSSRSFALALFASRKFQT
jgi:hypothetical protein